MEAPAGYVVTLKAPTRTTDQNAKFHAMVGDIAKAVTWGGKMRSPAQWKVLLVSGHAKATNEEFELIPGLEGEFVNLRESTALMSIRRGASLIEYTQAFGDMNGVRWSERIREESNSMSETEAARPDDALRIQHADQGPGLRWFVQRGATTWFSRGFRTKARADDWIDSHRRAGVMDWRVGFRFRIRGDARDVLIVNRNGEVCK